MNSSTLKIERKFYCFACDPDYRTGSDEIHVIELWKPTVQAAYRFDSITYSRRGLLEFEGVVLDNLTVIDTEKEATKIYGIGWLKTKILHDSFPGYRIFCGYGHEMKCTEETFVL